MGKNAKAVEQYIIGYQWGTHGQFIGAYSFPNNMDKEDIHFPPNTTLISPLTECPVDSEIAWNGESWEIRRAQLSHFPDAEDVPYEFYHPTLTETADGN